MADINGPVIIRHNPVNYFVKPGQHSHNVGRRGDRRNARGKPLRFVRVLLFVIGLCGIGYYGYTLSDQYIYQAFENWAFDQQIAGGRAVTFADYLREKTPLGFLVGEKVATPTAAVHTPSPASVAPGPLVEGSLLGRVEVKRLNLSAIVREGVDADTLRIAIGHVPSTSLPGAAGNFAIAAHRDTLFRALKDIKKDDLVTFESPAGTYTYQVAATKIVKPSDISVLQPNGGGLVPPSGNSEGSDPKLLTMITCYPFYYVGAAPKRFIVEARLVSTDSASKLPDSDTKRIEAPAAETPPHAPAVAPTRTAKHRKSVEPRHARVLSHSHRTTVTSNVPNTSAPNNKTPKKPGFWHKLFHGA